MLSADGVEFEIKKRQLLSQISFSVKQGESFAVVGHNGAGKTTLFHLVLGLKFRTAGRLYLNGQDVESPLARETVGFVPERPYLRLDLSFRQLMRFYGRLSGLSHRAIDERILILAEEMQLLEAIDQPLKTYSKGMLQKTLIAQAMIHDPQMLILDEPMSGLDVNARGFLKNKMRQWKQQGKTLFFSSHVVDDVKELADRVMVIEKGKITFLGESSRWIASAKDQAE